MKTRHILAFMLMALALMACSNQKEEQTPARFNLATYNLRLYNSGDSMVGDGWEARFPTLASLVRYHEFDIFGTQEGHRNQLDDLKNALPGFEYIGVGREDGKEGGEHSAIFYNTGKFDLVEHGDFWLSETPEVPGKKGWDAACPRICTWGKFRHKDSGREFLFFNLHMDHIGVQARLESAKLIRQKMQEIDSSLPVFLTGDFNFDQNEQGYKTITDDGTFRDSYVISDITYALNGTFNDFSAENYSDSRLDHIFVTPGIEIEKYGVLTDTYRSDEGTDSTFTSGNAPKELVLHKYRARTPSDHFPVVVRAVVE